MQQGWISLHRKIIDSAVWTDPNYLKLWMYCLIKASHKEREIIVGNDVINIKEGQFVTGRKSLAEDMNKGVKPQQRLSESTWYRYLTNLEKWQMLNIKRTSKNSVVSIVRWNEYQQSEHHLNSTCTTDEHHLNTNNNVNNGNNVNKDTSRSKLKFETHHFQLAELLFKEMKRNNENVKKPNLENWANTFRLMMERDKREGKEIQDIILFSQKHNFWHKNIMSANKLRDQFDRLKLEMKPKQTGGGLKENDFNLDD